MVLKYYALVDPQYGILSTKGARIYLKNTDSLQIDYPYQSEYFLGLLVFL